jgi:transcriptional regulator with XRE-family HTH domain
MKNHTHEGRNIRRFREMLGMKQETLAFELGEEWSQKKISLMEQKETVDQHTLEKVASVLQIPAKVLQNFNEEYARRLIVNSVEAGSDLSDLFPDPSPSIVDPWNKITELFERLLASEREKVTLMRQVLEWWTSDRQSDKITGATSSHVYADDSPSEQMEVPNISESASVYYLSARNTGRKGGSRLPVNGLVQQIPQTSYN